jgi:hypothetical protein
MGKLNRMMGEKGGQLQGDQIEKKKSWEDIPIMIGGMIKITPDEQRIIDD